MFKKHKYLLLYLIFLSHTLSSSDNPRFRFNPKYIEFTFKNIEDKKKFLIIFLTNARLFIDIDIMKTIRDYIKNNKRNKDNNIINIFLGRRYPSNILNEEVLRIVGDKSEIKYRFLL